MKEIEQSDFTKTKHKKSVVLTVLRVVALGILLSIVLTVASFTLSYLTSPSLYFIGHASIKLRTSHGKVIYIDPYYPTKFSYMEPADYILVTHDHSDHNNVSLCKLKEGGKIITYKEALQGGKCQFFDFGDIKIEVVPGDGRGDHTISNSVGYIVYFDGVSVYHAGDSDFTPYKYALINKGIVYALYSVNGRYTMDYEEATNMANTIGARYNIPIHGDGDKFPAQRNSFHADGSLKLFSGQVVFIE